MNNGYISVLSHSERHPQHINYFISEKDNMIVFQLYIVVTVGVYLRNFERFYFFKHPPKGLFFVWKFLLSFLNISGPFNAVILPKARTIDRISNFDC